MAPRLAATQGAGSASTKHNQTQQNQTSQQTAAQQLHQQQQQQQQQQLGGAGGAASSAASGGGGGGGQGVPALLLSKGYDVLGVIGEVSRQAALHQCRKDDV